MAALDHWGRSLWRQVDLGGLLLEAQRPLRRLLNLRFHGGWNEVVAAVMERKRQINLGSNSSPVTDFLNFFWQIARAEDIVLSSV